MDIKKLPTTRGINVLSSKVKTEIQREKLRAENRKLEIKQLQEDKRKYEEQIENYTNLYSKDRHDMEGALTSKEMGIINELLVKKVKEKDVQLSEQKDRYQQALNHIQDKEAESKTKIISLNIRNEHLEKEKDSRDRKIEHLQEKLQGIEINLERRDLKIKDLEERLDSIRTEMTCEKELLIKKMEKQKKQLSKQRDELHEASNQIYESDQSRIINSLKKDNQEKDYHIFELSEQLKHTTKIADDKNAKMLNRKVVEISQLNDRNEFLKQKMREKDSQLHKQHDQHNRTLERLRETETMANENKASLEITIQSLERNIERRDLHVKDLEKSLDSMKAVLSCGNERLEQKLIAKDKQLSVVNAQLEEVLNQLQETKSDQGRLLTSLKNENMCLLAQVKLRDLKINKLEEMLESTITETNKEAELKEIITSLERKLNCLKSELELRDQKIKQYEEILIGINFKMTQTSYRNEFLEIKLKEKDEHTDQRGRTLERLQKSKTELVGTIADLKKKNLHLETHIEDSDLKVKDLEKRFNSMRTELKDENKLLVNKFEEKDRDQREQLQQANNQLYKREVELNDIIISLKKENQEEDYRKSKLKDQLKQTLKKLDDKEADMTEINTSLNRKLECLEAEVGRRERNVRHLQELLNDRKIEVTNVSERNELLEKKLKEMDDRLREQNEQQRKNTQHLHREVEHREKDVREKDEKTSELKELLQQTLKKLHDIEIEQDETKTSLIKATGDSLADNNPNITDLSERIRPTKLAERCAELYDNQWTDAFDILDKHFDTEENVIEALLWILQESRDISADVRKLFKDCRRTVSPVAVGNLYKMYVSHLGQSTDKTLRTAVEVSSYTSECLEICWFMVIHDPTVVFSPLLRRGSSLNTDLYKPYTSCGTHVDYVVWPPLLLHEGGPILAKGVAQGYGKKSEKST
ncbi:interaptin-like [Mercenaria mercenaria]|uniref:interaptin-like n=1 Tax=Mercenaria mercenaria TaxID=6596 RepID=UPI00234E43E3|nr:interaptin-like [Mercenaria mercenaria]